MCQLTHFVATTLDGRIAAPDGSFDFFPFDPAYLSAVPGSDPSPTSASSS